MDAEIKIKGKIKKIELLRRVSLVLMTS